MAEDLGEITIRFGGEGGGDTGSARSRKQVSSPEQLKREQDKAAHAARMLADELDAAAKAPFDKITAGLDAMRGTLSGSGGIIQFLANQRGQLGLFGVRLQAAAAAIGVATVSVGLITGAVTAAAAASRNFADTLMENARFSAGGAMGAAQIRMAEMMSAMQSGAMLGPLAAAVAATQADLIQTLTPVKAAVSAIWGGVSALLAGVVKAAMPAIVTVLNGLLDVTIAILDAIHMAAESGALNPATGTVVGALGGAAIGGLGGAGLALGAGGLLALIGAPVTLPVLAIAGAVAGIGAIAGGALGYSVGANAQQVSSTLQQTLQQLKQFRQTYTNSLSKGQITNLNLWAQSLFGGLGSGALTGLGPPRIAPVRP